MIAEAGKKKQEHLIKDFNLSYTLNCGQVFRWNFTGSEWVGVVENSLVRAKQIDGRVIVETDMSREAISNYFRFDDDLDEIYRAISRDRNIKKAIEIYRGLHIVRQEPWECLVSYMCSSASNIPRIKSVVENICRKFGKKISGGYYTFPDPRRLSSAEESELRSCGIGFRAPFVLEAAKLMAGEEIELNRLRAMSYNEAKKELKNIKGVGDKIADCVLLFSLDRLEAFPVDRHIKRYMERTYFNSGRVSDEKIRRFAGEYFGRYCGYAQQYIFIHQSQCAARLQL